LADCRKFELHTFCDGSEVAYGAVCYIEGINEDGKVSALRVFSKCRLTPISRNALTTTPRIELNSAKLAVETTEIVCKVFTLNITCKYFWTVSVTF